MCSSQRYLAPTLSGLGGKRPDSPSHHLSSRWSSSLLLGESTQSEFSPVWPNTHTRQTTTEAHHNPDSHTHAWSEVTLRRLSLQCTVTHTDFCGDVTSQRGPCRSRLPGSVCVCVCDVAVALVQQSIAQRLREKLLGKSVQSWWWNVCVDLAV